MKQAMTFGLMAAIVLAFAGPAVAARAPQPPRPGCTAVNKKEYDSARKRNLLRTRNGEYLRSGSILRRQYWYCH
jgi:hypothetical protein